MVDRGGMSLAFGVVVRRYRKANGLSQEMLAEKADIHHTHVGLIERGERNLQAVNDSFVDVWLGGANGLLHHATGNRHKIVLGARALRSLA